LVGIGSKLGDDQRQRDFVPFGVGDADDRDVGHVGVCRDYFLDVSRVDVETTREDHVLLAIQNVEVALVIELADVAGL